MHALRPGPYDQPWLLAVAAPKEARAVANALSDIDHTDDLARAQAEPWHTIALNHRLHLVVTGVGKANAAAAVARVYDPDAHAGLCVLGVAGALPLHTPAIDVGDTVLATRCVDADTGLITPDGFSDVARMGFPPLPSIHSAAIDADTHAIDPSALPAHVSAPVATVSTCSGTDAHAHTIATRTGAACEAMEGAAAAFCAKRIAPDHPVVELRVISNTTGDRDRQRWDLPRALDTLARLASAL